MSGYTPPTYAAPKIQKSSPGQIQGTFNGRNGILLFWRDVAFGTVDKPTGFGKLSLEMRKLGNTCAIAWCTTSNLSWVDRTYFVDFAQGSQDHPTPEQAIAYIRQLYPDKAIYLLYPSWAVEAPRTSVEASFQYPNDATEPQDICPVLWALVPKKGKQH